MNLVYLVYSSSLPTVLPLAVLVLWVLMPLSQAPLNVILVTSKNMLLAWVPLNVSNVLKVNLATINVLAVVLLKSMSPVALLVNISTLSRPVVLLVLQVLTVKLEIPLSVSYVLLVTSLLMLVVAAVLLAVLVDTLVILPALVVWIVSLVLTTIRLQHPHVSTVLLVPSLMSMVPLLVNLVPTTCTLPMWAPTDVLLVLYLPLSTTIEQTVLIPTLTPLSTQADSAHLEDIWLSFPTPIGIAMSVPTVILLINLVIKLLVLHVPLVLMPPIMVPRLVCLVPLVHILLITPPDFVAAAFRALLHLLLALQTVQPVLVDLSPMLLVRCVSLNLT